MSFYLAEIRELRKDFVKSYKDGDLKKALLLGKRLLEIYKEQGELKNPGFAEDTHNVAVIFDELGFYDKAVEYYLEAAALKKARLGESASFADTLNNLAIAYSKLGQYNAALKMQLRVLEVRDKKLGRNHIDYIHTLYNLGNTYEALKQYDPALECHKQALEMSCGCKALNMIDIADIHASMAGCFEKKGNYKKAIFYYEFALDIIEKKQGTKSLHYIANAISLASVCEKAGFIGLAVEYCERVVEIRRRMFPEGHLDYVNNLNYLASLCYKDSQFDKSLQLHRTVLDLVEKNLGQKYLLYSDTLDSIALDFCGKKDFGKALEHSKKALELRRKTLSEGDVEITKGYMTLGEIAVAMEKYTLAFDYYEIALCIREKSTEAYKGAVAEVWSKFAQLFDQQGAYEAAAALYELSLETRASCFSERDDTDFILMKHLAKIREKQGEYGKSVLVCREMEQIAKQSYGMQHPQYAMALKMLGIAYQKAGDLAAAASFLEQALIIQREVLDEDNPTYIKTLEIFAEVCFSRGACAQAIQLYKERNDVNFEETLEEQREAACTLMAIANCYLKLGEKEKAQAYAAEAESKMKKNHILPNEKFEQRKEIYQSEQFPVRKVVRKRMRDGERRHLEQAVSFLVQLYRKVDDTIQSEKEKKAFVAFSLGEAYQQLGQKEEAIYWYIAAERDAAPNYYTRACIRLGEAYWSYAEEAKAFQKFVNAKAYLEEYGTTDSSDYRKILGCLGDCFYKKGDKETALQCYRSWNHLYQELCLPECALYDIKIGKFCKILTDFGMHEEAAQEYCTLAKSIRSREGETAKFAKLLLRIAMLRIHLEDAKGAEELLDRALLLAGKAGITTEKFGKVCDKVGRLYSLAGQDEKAIEALKLAYNQSLQGEKCITKEGLQLLSELLWKIGDNKAYFSVKNGCEME